MPTKWEVERAVLKSKLDPQPKLIMLVLNTWAEEKTAEIPAQYTPSLEKVAAATGLSKSTVAEWLTVLDEADWLFRERPTAKESLGAGRRTRYRLGIGDLESSPRPAVRASRKGKHGQAAKEKTTVTTVRTADSPLGGQTPSTHSPHGGQSTVRTADLHGPHGGHNIEPPTGVLDPTDNRVHPPSGSAAAAPPPPADALFDVETPPPSPLNGGQINRGWIDQCTAAGVKLASNVKARWGKAISNALGEGFNADQIQDALARMLAKGMTGNPAQLNSFLSESGYRPLARAAPAMAVSAPADLKKWKKGPSS